MSAATAASLVGVISIANGLGRVFWAWVSDLTGRKTAFIIMYLMQAILFWTFHSIGSATVLFIVTFIIVVCYGGGYGITPAFAADYFGARNIGAIYGLMLLPWAFPRLSARCCSLICESHGRLQPGAVPDRGHDDGIDDIAASGLAAARAQSCDAIRGWKCDIAGRVRKRQPGLAAFGLAAR